MNLNTLLGPNSRKIGATSVPTVDIQDDEVGLVQDELNQILSELNSDVAVREVLLMRHENICDQHTAYAVLDTDNADVRKQAAQSFAIGLAQNGFDMDAASGIMAACESEVEGVVESFNAVKRSMETMFKWIAEQWQKFTLLIAKYWAKFFGLIAITKRGWNSIAQRSKEYRDGNYSLETKDKIEITSAADNLILGTKTGKEKGGMSGSEAIADTTNWMQIGTMWDKTFKGYKMEALEDADAVIGKVVPGLKNVGFSKLGNTGHRRGDTADDNYTNARYLAGRYVCGYNEPDITTGNLDTADKIREASDQIRLITLEIIGTNVDNKAEDVVKLDALSLADIEKLAELNIDLCDQLLGYKGSKEVAALEKSLTKANKGYGKWLKDADTDDVERRELVKAASNLAVRYNSMVQRISVDFLQSYTQKARSVSESKATWCKRSLSNYKKGA